MAQDDTQNTLRDALEASFDAAEQGTLQTIDEVAIPSSTTERVRDESGKFAKKDEPVTENPSPVATKHDVPEIVDHSEPKTDLQRPTTWKKDYLPLWDKMQSGQPLTQEEAVKFLQYQNQREQEYKTGVSTYKAEAENAKVLQDAIAPFIPELQKHGIHPAAWINNLGRAHQTLALGSDQQRLEAFVQLAQDYRVPLEALLGGQQPDPNMMAFQQQNTQTKQELDYIKQWIENEKQQRLTGEINRVKSDVEHFPHFDQVRGTMAQLLDTGLASTLEDAYAKAIRMQDDVWQLEQDRLLSAARTESATKQHLAKAKAASTPRSSTPVGTSGHGETKDRRALLEESFDSVASGRV